jgi:hypothetical protein
MDITALKARDAERLILRHPTTGDELEASIELAGVDSKQYKLAAREIQTRKLGRQRRSRIDIEEIENDATDILTACVISWSGIEENGKAVECRPEEVRRIFSEYPFIREQVDSFVSNRGNFIKT